MHTTTAISALSATATLVLFATTLLPASPQSWAEKADDGAVVYKKFCVSCHGAASDASTPAGDRLHAPDLRSGKVQKQTDDELYKGIAYGYGHKEYPHVFIGRGVTQSQIKAVVAYIRRLGNADRKGKTHDEEKQ